MISQCADLTREESNLIYRGVLLDNDIEAQRELCRTDLFYLLSIAFMRRDVDKDWLYDRCREVEADPDGCLDIWAREHYKSTIITFAKSIQDILASHGDDPLPEFEGREVTIGIFSHTKGKARDFLEQIKRELEDNNYLKDLFPDILYQNPRIESPKWSRDGGITVKRKSNPKEATVEGHGVVDGQPTGAHFFILNYDDVVTEDSVTTPDQIEKTLKCWRLSLNLGSNGGKRRIIGTRYHFNDLYRTIIEDGVAKLRLHPATADGTMDGEPVFLTRKQLMAKRIEQGPYVFGCQLLLNPVADKSQGFKADWLRYGHYEPAAAWNLYMICDPANGKKKDNDYTAIAIIGTAPDGNYYLIDGVRDRLNLTERTAKIFEFHRKYKPVKTGYEKYGLQSDVEHIRDEMDRQNYRFSIEELGGTTLSKNDRIKKLVPVFEQGRFYLPRRGILFEDYENKTVDFVDRFVKDEYIAFPVSVHDDMFDCIARILDPNFKVVFPKLAETDRPRPETTPYRDRCGIFKNRSH